MDLSRLRRHVAQLHDDLHRLADRDPDQEVWWRAGPVLDAVTELVEEHLPNDPVLGKIRDMLRVAEAEELSAVRAADLVPLIGQVVAALGPEPARISEARLRADSYGGQRHAYGRRRSL